MNSNKLRSLPDSIGRLKCHTFAANGNLITKLTPAVHNQALATAQNPRDLLLDCASFASFSLSVAAPRAPWASLLRLQLAGQVAAMANLTWLSLCDNRLESLPKELGDCSKLERLHLMGNFLVELPEQVGVGLVFVFLFFSFSSQVKSYSPGGHEGSAQRKPQGPARWGRVVGLHCGELTKTTK